MKESEVSTREDKESKRSEAHEAHQDAGTKLSLESQQGKLPPRESTRTTGGGGHLPALDIHDHGVNAGSTESGGGSCAGAESGAQKNGAADGQT